jgi:hypothetical protein
MSEFIFMLTHHDRTIEDAVEVYREVRGSGLRYIGFKDVGATPEILHEITTLAHDDGLEVMLEVVSTTREDELAGISAARDVGVDWVLGGTHAEAGAELLRGTGIRYCPFPGTVVGHPSVLEGSLDQIADDARRLTALDGVHGVDLLAYRHAGVDPLELVRRVVAAAAGPVVVAGAIVTEDQIRDVVAAGAWGFTIGGAIFEDAAPGAPGVPAQIAAVLAASRVGVLE